MKNIFADLYNKVVSFFYKTDGEGENAKDVACSRLKLVLMQDRTNLPPIVMDRMRRELIELLSKYVELNQELLDLNFEQEDNQMALMLSIPVVRAKSETEIQEIIEKEALEKQRLEDLSIALGEVDETDEAVQTSENDIDEISPEAEETEKETDTENEDETGMTNPEIDNEEPVIEDISDKTEENKEESDEEKNSGNNSAAEPEIKEKENTKKVKSDSAKIKAVSSQNKEK